MNILACFFLTCVCTNCVLISYANVFELVMSLAVARLVAMTKSSSRFSRSAFRSLQFSVVEGMIGSVVLHKLLELIRTLVLQRQFVRCEILCILFFLGMRRCERILVS